MKVSYKYAAALTVSLGLFMAVLDSTIVNVALANMEESFHTDINAIQWVVTAYTLAQAAVIPAAGYLSNRAGIKRLFMLALAVFIFGSLLCGLSPHVAGAHGGDHWLVGFRVLQGLGGGMVFPLGTAIAFSVFPPAERAISSAVIAVPVVVAPAFGPTIGGLIVDSRVGWPGIFFLNVPIGIVSLYLIQRVLKPDQRERGVGAAPAFDWMGLTLSMLGVVLAVYAFALVSEAKPGTVTAINPNGIVYGWGYWLVWVLFAAGMALLAVFAVWELKFTNDPVIDLRLFASYDFTIASIATWFVRALVLGSFLILPLFLQQFQGRSAVATGLILMAQGVGSLVGVQTGSWMFDRIGPRAVVVIGALTLTLSTWLLFLVKIDSGWRFFVPILVIRGFGFGWTNLPLQTVSLQTITGAALPKASSLYRATAQVFTSIGVAISSTILVQRTAAHATAIASAAHAAGHAPPADLLLRAGTAGTSDVFGVLTIATAVLVVVSFFLPRRSLKQLLASGARQPAAASQQHAHMD